MSGTMEVNFKGMQQQLKETLDKIDSIITSRGEQYLNPEDVVNPDAEDFRDIAISDLQEDEKDEILVELQDCFGLLRTFTNLIES